MLLSISLYKQAKYILLINTFIIKKVQKKVNYLTDVFD